MTNTQQQTARQTRFRNRVTFILAFAILIPSLLGFGGKLVELFRLVDGDPSGAFALSPITNYLSASLGFLFLFFWAIAQGMFHDIERPKYTMLELDEKINRASGTGEDY